MLRLLPTAFLSVVAWNNCEMPPRHEGVGVYGGRDALHIAVSDDEGSLNDRMFDPTNDPGEEFAVFRAELEILPGSLVFD